MTDIYHTALIQLTEDKFAIVDFEDYARVSAFKWCATVQKHTVYATADARCSGPRKKLFMHRLIIGAQPGTKVDHRNHNGLDNRKANLRSCSIMQNSHNRRKRAGCSSKFKGVTYRKDQQNKWATHITNTAGKKVYLGSFSTETEAALAYNEAASKEYGDFALLNPVSAG